MKSIVSQPINIGSYPKSDVLFLLKDLSNIQLEDSTLNREKNVQLGEHYSESLPIEYQPPNEYVDLFWQALKKYKKKIALCTGIVGEQIVHSKGDKTILVSLARAGTPVGILIKRYIEKRFGISMPHYSISIIRDRGIDENALHYILSQHPGYRIQFIDGWTGKGAISIELTKSCKEFKAKYGIELDDSLAVIADPGHCTTIFGTREDFLIPSACLNSTVSGLISRTVLNRRFIFENDFHGAKYYQELKDLDVSNEYVDVITAEFSGIYLEASQIALKRSKSKQDAGFLGMKDVERIQKEFQISHTNFIKPGVGETTRVLLRRVPWKILMKDPTSPDVKHILLLAKEKGVEVIPYSRLNYLCCGLIKSVKESTE